jgi:hypothetical protein
MSNPLHLIPEAVDDVRLLATEIVNAGDPNRSAASDEVFWELGSPEAREIWTNLAKHVLEGLRAKGYVFAREVNFSRFEFAQYANACPCLAEDCECDPVPRDEDDDYVGDFSCDWCASEGRDGGDFVITSGQDITLADVLLWAASHMKTCVRPAARIVESA